jgi:hypothetical protein
VDGVPSVGQEYVSDVINFDCETHCGFFLS